MGHRKWMLFGAGAESMEGAMREHNALYDAWVVERDRADDLLKDRNTIQGKLDEARKRIAELESPTRVPFSDAPAGVPSVEALVVTKNESIEVLYAKWSKEIVKADAANATLDRLREEFGNFNCHETCPTCGTESRHENARLFRIWKLLNPNPPETPNDDR